MLIVIPRVGDSEKRSGRGAAVLDAGCVEGVWGDFQQGAALGLDVVGMGPPTIYILIKCWAFVTLQFSN